MTLSRRTFLAGTAAIATTAAAAPYVHAQKKGGTLRFVPHADLKILDPIWTTAYITRNHGYMIFDTLFALDEHLKLQPDVAARCWELVADPRFGLQTDARFDSQGFRNVLALRAEIEGGWGGKAPPPERYIDLSYYDGALKRVESK